MSDYIPQWGRASFNDPINAWSMQSGASIFIQQGDQEICIDPDEMVQLLLGHSFDYYIQRVVGDDEGNGEHLEPIEYIRKWSSSVPTKEEA